MIKFFGTLIVVVAAVIANMIITGTDIHCVSVNIACEQLHRQVQGSDNGK